jgi:hypothetical protein
MTTRGELVSVVRRLERAANSHAIDEVMDVFTDDVELELVGLARLVGKEDLRRVFEYDEGVNGEIHLLNCTARDDVVECVFIERNDRLRVAGIGEMRYPSCVFAFTEAGKTGPKIRSWRAAPDPDAMRAFDRFWREVRRWIVDHHPADAARIFTSDGRFVRNASNGECAVRLAREYRSARSSGPST